ncbi:MAG: ABC transporter ATP-binding protein [candidate division NC10 bacterium]|nr:ABC transporter ATP-binding protein [candidate division NC10 bacterium]
MDQLLRLLPFVRPRVLGLLVVFGFSLFSILLGLATPLFTKILIDDALLKGNGRLLAILVVAMFATRAMATLAAALNSYLYSKIAAEVLFRMRLSLYQHLLTLSPKFYAQTRIGEILSRINTDMAEVQRIATDVLFNLVLSLLSVIGTGGFLVWLNWRLTLVSVVFLPLALLALGQLRPKVEALARAIRDRNADLASLLVERLSGVKFIQAFGAEGYEVERFVGKSREVIRTLLRYQITSSLAGGIPGLLLTASTAVAFLYGGYLVITGGMTVGALVAFTAYQARAFGPLQGLIDLSLGLQRARVSLLRVFELFDVRPEVVEKKDALPLEDVPGEIVFKKVSFAYQPGDFILKDLSFIIPPGSTVAIVGPSGSGKSSIVDLLMRFYDPLEGSIELRGRNLKDFTLASLRRHVVLIDQETFLFHATIEENIRYGRRDATREEVIAAAKAASIHDFIESLLEGYNTMVGERGMRLSEGEKQRIAIARAILRDPKVLILDEATSSLDWLSEQNVRKALGHLMKGRTTIIVTHRLSSIKDVDHILVLHGERIVQAGSHEELLKEEGLYRTLWLAEQGSGRLGEPLQSAAVGMAW